MKPIVILEGQKAKHKADKNKTTILFYFPKPTKDEGEKGEITLIDGDRPHVVIKASKSIQIDIE